MRAPCYVFAPGCEAVDEAGLANVAVTVIVKLDPLQVLRSATRFLKITKLKRPGGYDAYQGMDEEEWNFAYDEVHELHSAHRNRGVFSGQHCLFDIGGATLRKVRTWKRTLRGSADIVLFRLVRGKLGAERLDEGDITCLVFVLVVCRLMISTKPTFSSMIL